MKHSLRNIIILIIVPVVLGLIFTFAFQKEVIFEVTMIVFGLIELIILVSRINQFDKSNRTNQGTYKPDKSSREYLEYRYIQEILLVSALLNIALSYVYFMVFGG